MNHPLQSLVLIPGLLNDADLWRDQISALSDIAQCQVADITAAESIEAMAQSILAAAPAQFALAGFSLGGFVAQEILRQAPERIARLALLDTSCRADTPERAAGRRRVNAMARQPGRFMGIGDKLLESYLHPTHMSHADKVARIQGMTVKLGPEVLIRQNSVSRKCGEAVLSAFNRPCLILCGESDRITPVDEHRAMAELIPQADLVVLPEAGHMTPIEQPDQVSSAMRRWLLS